MTTAHKFLLTGGGLLLVKGLLVSAMLVLGTVPVVATTVLGAVAEVGIGLGIVGEHGPELRK